MQTVTRKGSFDAAHRVMNESVKCYNNHGHTYHVELTYSFENLEDIGYAIDFKEIKRVHLQFIDDFLDHAAIYNFKDYDFILPCLKHNTKYWLMSLNGVDQYCNPTAENISKEIFIAIDYIVKSGHPALTLSNVRLYETDNCFVDCTWNSITLTERDNFLTERRDLLDEFLAKMGKKEYDDRKIKHSEKEEHE